MAKANHGYFFRKGQVRPDWDSSALAYRLMAENSFHEMLHDGPINIIEKEIHDARAEAPVLRMRLEMFIEELRGLESSIVDEIADKLEATINAPMEG
jgi:ABC-type phosphate transport system ATPase subunit